MDEGSREGELLFHGYRVSILQDEKVSGDLLCNNGNILKHYRSVLLKMVKMVNKKKKMGERRQ